MTYEQLKSHLAPDICLSRSEGQAREKKRQDLVKLEQDACKALWKDDEMLEKLPIDTIYRRVEQSDLPEKMAILTALAPTIKSMFYDEQYIFLLIKFYDFNLVRLGNLRRFIFVKNLRL